MTSWFDKTLRRMSFQMGSLQAGTRPQGQSQPPEVQEFKKMCSGMSKNDDDPEQCMIFCLEQFESKPMELILEAHLDSDICKIIRHFSHNTEKYLSDPTKAEMAFNFLNFAIRFYVANPRNDTALYRIIVKVAQTNDQSLVEMVLNFTQESFAKQPFTDFIFQGVQLEVLWTNVFVKNPVAGPLMSPIVNMAASQYKFADVEKVQQMLLKSMNDFNELTIAPEMLSNALLFVGYVIRDINTGDYLPNLLPLINEWATSLDTLAFLEPMIAAETSDPPAIWAAIDAICANEELPLNLLESALMAIYNSGAAPCPDPSIFSFNSFVPRILELSEHMQKTLFETIARSDVATVADFFCSVQPLSQTGVSTEFLWQVATGISWGLHVEPVLKYLIIDTEMEEVQLDLDSDEYFYKMVLNFIDQLSPQSTIVTELADRSYEMAKEADEKAANILRLTLERALPSSYMPRILSILESEEVPDNMLRLFATVASKVSSFNSIFFKSGGAERIGKIVQTEAGLDFLAALVCDGPVAVVDDYISKHYNDLPFGNYTPEQLTKVMMGVPQSSRRNGFMRIPSLCHYVQDFPLVTPFDRYVCGAMAVKYFKPTSDQIRKFAGTYMDRDLAMKACLDPEILPSLTDPTYAHFNLFQFHPTARKCLIQIKRPATFTFWFLVAEISDPTVLATFPSGSLIMETNGYFATGNKNIHCPLHQWHMVTLCTSVKNNNQKVITVYIDAKPLTEINTTDQQTITLGSENNCHATWYVSAFTHHSSKVLEPKKIARYFDLGPRSPSKSRIQAANGVKLVGYRGILRYMHVLGGPTFIFGSMLNCLDEEHYMMFLQAAFNMRRLGVFSEPDFFSSLKYVIRRKLDLYSSNAEQIIMHELTVDEKLDWKNLHFLMGDYCMMASDAVHFQFLANALTASPHAKESEPFFHMIVDTFVFVELSDRIQETALQLIKRFIQGNHELLKKLPMVIVAMTHPETDDPVATFNDSTRQKKQKILYDLWTSDLNIFLEQTPIAAAFSWVRRMNDELSVELFHFISTICAEAPSYFVFAEFKKIAPFLWLHPRDEKIWISLFQFLTQAKSNVLADFMTFTVVRKQIFPIVLDLLTAIMPYDITNTNEGSLSFNLIHLVFSLLVTQSASLFELIGPLQTICSLGFAERPPCQLPFGTTPKSLNIIRRISRPKIFQSTVDGPTTIGLTPPDEEIENIAEMDLQLEQATKKHMELFEADSTQAMEIDIPEPELPTEWDSVSRSPVTHCVAMIAAKTLVEVSSDTSRFKKCLAPLCIYGADVYPSVAILMHRKVILALLDNRQHISADAFNVLLEFLTYRVLEGWWRGHEMDLFRAIAPTITASHRNVPMFVVACLKSVTSQEDMIEIAKVLSQNKIGSFCATDRKAVVVILHLLVTEEIAKVAGADQLFMDLGSKLEKNDLIEAVCNRGLAKWIEAFQEEGSSTDHSYCDQMMTNASSNISQVSSERMDLTRRSRKSDLMLFIRANLDQVNYFRRALRFQFFYRVNRSALVVLDGLNSLFKMAGLIDHSRAIPERYSLVPAPHPYVIPMKMVPMMFPYHCTYEKSAEELSVPVSYHPVNLKLDNIPELEVVFCGPKCLEGWRLPPALNYGLSSIIEERYSPVSPVFGCSLLIGPEPLACVGIPTKDALYVLMYANVDEKGVVTLDDHEVICSYPLIEMGMYGLLGPSSIFLNHVTIEIRYDLVTHVTERTYVYEPRAVDIFVASGSHYTLVFDYIQQKTVMQRLRKRVSPSGKRGVGFASFLSSQKLEAVVKMWTSGKLSNMDYLLYLNEKSGRSFNDYSQYPVFPWVISDYEAQSPQNLKLRDLSKPMGMQSESRIEQFKEMYKEADPPYNYGTHYSHPVSVLHVLMRIEPNTIYNVHFHNGFDSPDRLFCSVEELWKGAAELNQADVQEAVPELYALPCLYENTNHLVLPKKTNGECAETVTLPTWAKGDAMRCVWIMRQALESSRVSRRLSLWIDLIFGYKQRGEAAVEAVNVFHPLSYSDCHRSEIPEERQAEQASILSFGQCPKQLFQKENPRCQRSENEGLMNRPSVNSHLKSVNGSTVHLMVDNEEIYTSSMFKHYIGSAKTLLSISDGMFLAGNAGQYDSAIFDMTASSLSSDRMYVAVCCKYGALLTYFVKEATSPPTLVPISRTLCPGTQWTCCAISSHYGIVCAASPNDLCMYDMTTGYLLRHYSMEGVNNIAFDETHDFVIVTTKTDVIVFGLDFREIANASTQTAITSLCSGDDIKWSPQPIFATGHSDGSRTLWGVDVLGKALKALPLEKTHGTAVTAIHIFQDNKALISCDAQGMMSMVSIRTMKAGFLKNDYFEGCCGCQEPLRRSETFNCTNCGLPYCRKCFSLSAAKCRVCESSSLGHTLPSLVHAVGSPRMSFDKGQQTPVRGNMGASLGTGVRKQLSVHIGSFRPRASMAQIFTSYSSSAIADTLVQDFSVPSESIQSEADDSSPRGQQGSRSLSSMAAAARGRRITFESV